MRDYTNILLTGASGFIGRHIMAAFQVQSITPDTLHRGAEANVVCDLEREIPVLHKHYDAVIHVAGTQEAHRADALNNSGTQRLLDALTPNPPRHFTYISSVEVYGLNPGENVPESCFLRPDTDYARSKIRAEKLLEKWCATYGVGLTILRLATTAGSGMHGRLDPMVRAICKGYYMHIRGNTARRSLVMADDVAKAVLLTIGVEGIYNVTDGIDHSVIDIADAIAANITAGKRILSLPRSLIKWPLKLFGGKSGLRRTYEELTLTATYSVQALREKVDFNPYNTIEVMSRRHPSYPYKE